MLQLEVDRPFSQTHKQGSVSFRSFTPVIANEKRAKVIYRCVGEGGLKASEPFTGELSHQFNRRAYLLPSRRSRSSYGLVSQLAVLAESNSIVECARRRSRHPIGGKPVTILLVKLAVLAESNSIAECARRRNRHPTGGSGYKSP